jgi:hypothetical protein
VHGATKKWMRMKDECNTGSIDRWLLDDCLETAVLDGKKEVTGWIHFGALRVFEGYLSSETRRNPRRERNSAKYDFCYPIFLTIDTDECFG